MPEGTTVVTILPDSIRNYMTKHLMDEWMYERELLPPPVLEQNEEWYNRPVSDLPLKKVFRNHISPQAGGMAVARHTALSNFQEGILQPTKSKMSPTSNLGL